MFDKNLKNTNTNNKNLSSANPIDETPETLLIGPGESLLEELTYQKYYSYLVAGEEAKYVEGKKPKEPHDPRDCFCEGFFIASFPEKNGKVIEKSQKYPAMCMHSECSILPAMQPEIIYRYPLQDTKTLELNNLAATICFPTGIKVCYNDETEQKVTKSFNTPITTQTGDRYYMVTFHFMLQVPNTEFTKKYEMHPLKHHLMKLADSYLDKEIDKKKKEIEQTLEFCQELGFKDYVYVPYCICLISKFPFIKQMEKCLLSIFELITIKNTSGEESSTQAINKIILYLIHSVPIPNIHHKLKFYMPYLSMPIELNCPKFKDMALISCNLTNLLYLFSIENIITIFRLLLFEKKILFVDKDYNRLSEVTDSFINLLYPFQWIHTYIPIMSDQMVKYLETFLPFVNGINETLMEDVTETLIENEDEVYIIYLDTKNEKDKSNQIDMNFSLKEKKRVKLKQKMNETTPNLPNKIVAKLSKELKAIKDNLEDLNSSDTKTSSSDTTGGDRRALLDLKIRGAFVESIAEMFYDYKSCVSIVEDDVVFNTNLLLSKRPQEDNYFYKEFVETQLFQMFIQNILKDDYNYFNTTIEQLENKKNNTNSKSTEVVEIENLNKNLNANKNEMTYIMKPPTFLGIENKPEIQAMEKELHDKYPPVNSGDLELSGIKKEEKRIVDNFNVIKSEDYDKNNQLISVFPGSLNKLKKIVNAKKAIIDTGKTSKIQSMIHKINKIEEKKKSKPLITSFGKKELELDDKEKDSLKEIIKDMVIKIFKCEPLDINKDKKEMINAINNGFGRQFFLDLLMQNKNNVMTLQKDHFEFLKFCIYNALLFSLKVDESEKIYEQVINFCKSCYYFKYQEKKTSKLIWDDICPKLTTFKLLLKSDLWKKWTFMEIKEKNIQKTNEGDIIGVMNELVQKMLEIKLEKEFIKKSFENISGQLIKTEQLKDKYLESLIERISGCKYNI